MRSVARIDWLDGWRGAALVCVLASHFGGPYFLGRFGVDAFFVLSGLLMAKVLCSDKQALRPFFVRRIARIVPALYVYVGATFAAEAVLRAASAPVEIASTLLFLRTYTPSDSDHWITALPLAHLWSLSVEEHAYLLLALTATAGARLATRTATLLLLMALGCAGTYMVYRSHPPASVMPYTARTECAAYPILLSAGLYLLRQRFVVAVSPVIPITTLLTAVGLGIQFQPMMSVTHLVIPTLLALTLNALVTSTPPSGLPTLRRLLPDALAWPWLRRLGLASFSIYLWQQPAHFLIKEYGETWPQPMAFSAGLVISLLLGWLSYLWIEQPARRWIVRRFAPTPQ